MNPKDIRVRFAPSPTGHLHIGGVRTALFNWLFARHHQGTYLLRIEDTDQLRSTKAYLESQLASLRWLGLEPDEPLVFQSERLLEHAAFARNLLAEGKAYRCYCPARPADEVISDLEAGKGQLYDGTCRKLSSHPDASVPYAIRFAIPEGLKEVTFEDQIRGMIRVKREQLDDFVILRQDGWPIYNFSVVVDDHFMKVSHVIRGEDHLSNTVRQVLLFQALGYKLPLFAHLPLILGKSGGKLSKRDAAVSVEEYRARGFMGDALCNYLVRLGWSHGNQEIFSREELINHFSLEHVGKKGAIFDTQKLEWLNGIYIRQASYAQLCTAIEQMDAEKLTSLRQLWGEPALEKLVNEYKQRTLTLQDLCQQVAMFAQDPDQLDFGMLTKWWSDRVPELIGTFKGTIQQSSDWHAPDLLETAKSTCSKYDQALVVLAQSLRLGLTGSIQSPGVFELMSILGKERSIKRLDRFLNSCP